VRRAAKGKERGLVENEPNPDRIERDDPKEQGRGKEKKAVDVVMNPNTLYGRARDGYEIDEKPDQEDGSREEKPECNERGDHDERRFAAPEQGRAGGPVGDEDSARYLMILARGLAITDLTAVRVVRPPIVPMTGSRHGLLPNGRRWHGRGAIRRQCLPDSRGSP
jgi:hypothetical protein